MDHDYQKMSPVLVPSYIPKVSSTSWTDVPGGIIPESSTTRESIRIPGTSGAYLTYFSTGSGAPSTLTLKLTPVGNIPATLAMVHLKVKVSGVAFEKSLEAEAGLTYVYRWNKRNVYNQKVYGVVRAKVEVGFEYTACQGVIWVKKSVEMRGFDVDISNVGGWNLNFHHHFNSFEGMFAV